VKRFLAINTSMKRFLAINTPMKNHIVKRSSSFINRRHRKYRK